LDRRVVFGSGISAQAANHSPVTISYILLHSYLTLPSDLKPDNILLDAMGHAHITDFNVAIHYSERRMHTSVAGSMAYMSPEVVGRKGYTWCTDWWSLGITAYELLFHKRPFDGRSAERMTQSILKDPLRFPEDAMSKCSKSGIHFLQGVSNQNG
jgi:serine/threonine kinase 32